MNTKYFILFTFPFLLILLACEENPTKFPVNFVDMSKPENAGAFARVVNSSGESWDINELNNEEFNLTLEFYSGDNGKMVNLLEFYVGYIDGPTGSVGDIATDKTHIVRSFDDSSFQVFDESGLPRITTTFTPSDLLGYLNINESDVVTGAKFTLRWQIHLSNGKVFGVDNSSERVTGGSFYLSPFAMDITITN